MHFIESSALSASYVAGLYVDELHKLDALADDIISSERRLWNSQCLFFELLGSDRLHKWFTSKAMPPRIQVDNLAIENTIHHNWTGRSTRLTSGRYRITVE